MSNDPSPFALGTPVLFSHILRRDTSAYPLRVWRSVALVAEQQGIIVGKRTLMDLNVPWEYEAGYVPQLESAQRFPAYLIAYDLYRRPVKVLPEHVRLIGPL